jgi:arylsulfatase A-like enzyme
VNRRLFLQSLAAAAFAQRGRKPNFIVILADDLGYGDLGCYGSPNIRTPHLDRMAREGVRFTSLYAQPVCGPSRSALMTGCYPPRNSLAFNHLPGFETGIHSDEVTLPEVLRPAGYTSMIIGKWHLGDHPKFLPLRHGFDRFFGLPYSNDMWRFHPRMPLGPEPHPRLLAARRRAELTGYAGQGTEFPPGGGFPAPLPLYEDDAVIETDSDQSTLTRRFTEKTLDFISANKARPFFLYVAHVMPHVPLFAGSRFAGVSRRGLYGDTVEELDWSTGVILSHLKASGLDHDTLVLFASDNGPWLQYGIDGGSAGPLRNGKGTQWEGGIRVPGIFRWPGRIPDGQVTSELATTMDLLPTFARMAGTSVPAERVIDGKDIWFLLSGQAGAKTPYDAFFYFGADLFGEPGTKGPTPGYETPKLQAIRSGDWKLHVEDGTLRPVALYDLANDVGESKDVLSRNSGVADRLHDMAVAFVAEMRKNIRPLGRI